MSLSNIHIFTLFHALEMHELNYINPFPTVSVKLTDSVVFTHIFFVRFGITLRNVDIFYICIHHYIPEGAGFKAILFLT